jgi:hypothetical protein
MVDARSSAPAVVTALVSAGLVDASRRDDAQRVVMRALGVPEKRISPRALLVEIAAYVGSALVVASIGLFLSQYWAEFPGPVQVTVLAAVTLVLATAGLAASRVGSGYAELRVGRDEVRRRLASALLCAAAAAAGVTVGRLVDRQLSVEVGNENWPIVTGAMTALVLTAAAYAYAPSAFGQVTMAIATFMIVTGGWSLFDQDQADTLWPGLAFLVVGVVWTTSAEGELFREVVQARAIGAALMLFGAQFTRFSDDHANLAYLLMLLVAVAAFVMYVLKAAWPYLVVGVLGITLVVPEAIIDWTGGSLGPAGAVLVAGMTLLAAAMAGFRVRKSVGEGHGQSA